MTRPMIVSKGLVEVTLRVGGSCDVLSEHVLVELIAQLSKGMGLLERQVSGLAAGNEPADLTRPLDDRPLGLVFSEVR